MLGLLVAGALALGTSPNALGQSPAGVREEVGFLARCTMKHAAQAVNDGFKTRRMVLVEAQSECVDSSSGAASEKAETDIVAAYVDKWFSERPTLAAKYPH